MKTRWYIVLIGLALFLTACPDPPTQPPPAPQGFAGVPTSSTSVQLSWIATPGAVSYALSRSVDGGAFITVSDPINTTTYSDTGLSAGKTYTYQLRAQNSAGQSSATQTAVTTQAPINNFNALATSSTSVNLTWTAVPGASSYRLERKTGSGAYAQIATPSGASYNDTGLTPNTTYTYRLSALQSGAVIAASESNAVTTPAPSAPGNPTNLTFSNVTTTGLTLTWTAPSGGADSYTVELKTGAGSYAQVGTPTGTSFTDSGLTPGTTYTYRVKSVGAGGSSSGVEASQATLSGNFTATALTTKRVQLDWSNTPNQARCLYRKQGGGAYSLVVSTQATWSSYIDTVPSPSQTYTYGIAPSSGSCPTTPGSLTESTVNVPGAGPPLKVLFIGNSLTFVNSVPQMIQTLANDAGEARAFQFEMVVIPGASLECHYTLQPPDCTTSSAKSRIAAGGWYAVVLQDATIQPVCFNSSFTTYSSKFNTDIAAVNAKTVLMLNWVRTDTNCPALNYGNATLAQKTYAQADALSSAVAPVGAAWAALGAPSPAPELYLGRSSTCTTDQIHANVNGSYLAASVYYSVFYKRSPVGLTNQVMAMQNCSDVTNVGATMQPVTINSATANTLQTTAWQTYQSMDSKYRLP